MRDFEADRKLCDAATPGPWESAVFVGSEVGAIKAGSAFTRDDIKFIAQAREGWPAALDEISRLIERYTDVMFDIRKMGAENARIRIALHDAINRPMGVVPDSAVEFYDQDKGRE